MGERQRIGQRHIKARQPGEVVWDWAVTGFGARRQKGEARTYFLFYRTAERRQRWYTIGRHDAPWTPDTARDEARRLLGDNARGGDPAAAKQATRKAITVGELCDRSCGNGFKSKRSDARFCSGKCRQQAHRRRWRRHTTGHANVRWPCESSLNSSPTTCAELP